MEAVRPALTQAAAFRAEHVRRYHAYGHALAHAKHAAISGHYADRHKSAWVMTLIALGVYDRLAELKGGQCAT